MFKCWIGYKIIPAVSIHTIDAQITAKNAKATAIKTAYSQLAGKPIEHFQACQWNALIDHAIIGANQIRFIFRAEKEIAVKL